MTPGNAAWYESVQVQGRDRYRYPPPVPVALKPDDLKRAKLTRLNDLGSAKARLGSAALAKHQDEQVVEFKRLIAIEVFCSHYLSGQLRDLDTELFTVVAKRGTAFAAAGCRCARASTARADSKSALR